MRYKVGEKVVLRDDLEEVVEKYRGVEVLIKKVDGPGWYVTTLKTNIGSFRFLFTDKEIDHKKTAGLNKGILEKIVAAKNQVDKKKALKHYQEQLDAISSVTNAIQPNHYKKNGKDLIDNWKDMFDEKEFRAIMKSNIMRYTVRYEEKNGIEDLFKIIEYTERLIEWEESLE